MLGTHSCLKKKNYSKGICICICLFLLLLLSIIAISVLSKENTSLNNAGFEGIINKPTL